MALLPVKLTRLSTTVAFWSTKTPPPAPMPPPDPPPPCPRPLTMLRLLIAVVPEDAKNGRKALPPLMVLPLPLIVTDWPASSTIGATGADIVNEPVTLMVWLDERSSTMSRMALKNEAWSLTVNVAAETGPAQTSAVPARSHGRRMDLPARRGARDATQLTRDTTQLLRGELRAAHDALATYSVTTLFAGGLFEAGLQPAGQPTYD
jgi:hypothetical protein